MAVIQALSETLFGNSNNVGVVVQAGQFEDGTVLNRIQVIQIASRVDTNVGAGIGQTGVESFENVGPGVSG